MELMHERNAHNFPLDLAASRTRDRSLVDSSNLHDGEHMHTRDVKQKGDGIKELATPLFSAFSKSVIQHFCLQQRCAAFHSK